MFLFVCLSIRKLTLIREPNVPLFLLAVSCIYIRKSLHIEEEETLAYSFFFNFAFHFVNDNKWSVPCLYLHIYVTITINTEGWLRSILLPLWTAMQSSFRSKATLGIYLIVAFHITISLTGVFWSRTKPMTKGS